jgi:hypothetical protein
VEFDSFLSLSERRCNVHPCVPKNPACRNDFMVWGSQISTSEIYKVIISLLLFFSYFSTRIRVIMRKYHGCGYTVDRPIDGVKSRFGGSPLLYYNYQPLSKFRGHGMKVESRKNISLRFEDTKHKETCT